jgi:general secretion pathway protein I
LAERGDAVRHLLTRRRSGFTLIETLVAFAVLALGMSSLMTALSGATRNETRADFLLRASREGQSHLDSLGVDGPIVQGETSGSYDDGLLWTLVVEPYVVLKSPLGGAQVGSFWAYLSIRRPGSEGSARDGLTLTALKIVQTSEPAQ